jgi:hypothetical protein
MQEIQKAKLGIARLLTSAVFAFATAHFGFAERILDQSWTNVSGASIITGFNRDWGLAAQTFTVGTSGYLATIEVYVDKQDNTHPNPGALEVSIWSVSGGVPAVELHKRQVPHSLVPMRNSPNWVEVDFSDAAMPLVAGELFAIVLGSTGPTTNYTWYGTGLDPYYADGLALNYPYELDRWLPGTLDPKHSELFKQYVTAVPEPHAFVFAVTGVACLGLARRRRRNRE